MKRRERIACRFLILAAAGALIWLAWLPAYSVVLVHNAADSYTVGCNGSGTLVGSVDCGLQHPCSLESCRIVVSECFGRGRLGNSMFILASTLAVARRHGLQPAVPASPLARARLVELEALFNVMTSPLVIRSWSALAYRGIHESGWSIYNPAVRHASSFGRLTTLGCFMQSWQYFRGHEDAVRATFTLAYWYKQFAERYFRNVTAALVLLANYTTVSTTQPIQVFVAVHVRRGDMVPQKENYNVADERYISRACHYFRNKYLNATSTVVFVVSSDDPAWSRAVMDPQQRDGAFVVYTNGTAEEDMAVLASCHHAVITSGTFGWWAAWLTGGEVVYFRDFVQPSSVLWSGYKADDYYPPHWLGLTTDGVGDESGEYVTAGSASLHLVRL